MTQVATPGAVGTEIPAAHGELTEDPILRAAAHLFYRQGIAAVSIQQIRAEAGVSLKALYAHYSSKDALVTAYIRLTHEAWLAQLRETVAAAGTGTSDRLDALFGWLRRWFSTPDFVGCGIANTRGEKLPAAAREIVREHGVQLREFLSGLAGSAAGGDRLYLLVEGAIAAAAASGEPHHADTARELADSAGMG